MTEAKRIQELIQRLDRLADEIVLERQPASMTQRNASVAMQDAAATLGAPTQDDAPASEPKEATDAS